MNNELITHTKAILNKEATARSFSHNTLTMSPAANVSHTYAINVNFPPKDAAYFFTALGEVLWTPDWSPSLIKGNGFQRNDVFLNTASGNTLFVVTNFDTERGHISYVRLDPNLTVATIDLSIKPSGKGSQVDVTYRLTALNTHSENTINALTAEAYQSEMKTWEGNIAMMEKSLQEWLHYAQQE
ncbi:hypothetical protein [Enterovibrio nigricans]|uniref:Polyketide cyclase / dehydrase and lipid transport n=1 Tax=Enterovibrio nigricans DSM 22720 TaxID=1121868 RepID=A0A1T4V2J5_9GAMM|nr:hypothetical protein [Enterovibrio nigricans]PKF50323.1 hypothetical protein AT251_12370 [Enterovibrio nigricans]SKA59169.1 hypothetical protein SAMN02745132_03085 [Enterovibrio nigricans DSM 22720]